MKNFALALFAFLAVFAASARAQNPFGMGGNNNCMTQQLAQLCPDDKPGTPGFALCSRQHAAEAMAACQKSTTDAATAASTKKTSDSSPCVEDSKKFCPGKWPGTPEYSSCMRSHMSDVSPACAAWGKEHAGMKGKSDDSGCVADAKKLCPGLTVLDGPKFTSCMVKNYDSLSPACQAKFKGVKTAGGGAHNECMAALQKLCPDLQPGDSGAMAQCMMTHSADVPPSCRNHGKSAGH